MSVADTAGDRIERMLAIVPWIAQQPGGTASIDEVCERFTIGRDRLVELLETVACTGLPPYDPSTLVEAIVDADSVSVFLPAHLRSPLHLTAEQTFALMTACEALLEAPGAEGDSPLRRAHDKLLAAVGSSQVVVHVERDTAPSDITQLLRSAVAERMSVDLEYHSDANDRRSNRRLDPYAVVERGGLWYVQGHDHSSDSVRVFRIDRITDAVATDTRFVPPDPLPEFGLFSANGSTPLMTLAVAPGARWVPEHYPCEAIERLANGGLRLTIGFANVRALERLVLLLGSDLVTIEGDPVLVDAGRSAASRVLANYR